jgi:hypothetical protein
VTTACRFLSPTGLSHVVDDSIAAALSQQLVTDLLKTALLQLCHNGF